MQAIISGLTLRYTGKGNISRINCSSEAFSGFSTLYSKLSRMMMLKIGESLEYSKFARFSSGPHFGQCLLGAIYQVWIYLPCLGRNCDITSTLLTPEAAPAARKVSGCEIKTDEL